MKEVDLGGRKIKVTSTVDAVGLFCPIPIVKLKLELAKLASNQVVEVLADDSGFAEDVVNWCKETAHELLSITKNDEDVYVAYVERK
ncbi:MAG: sulfurtransferase TusA family protein [Deltaproteobacteria bacterium]|nr:sulfurtransferase TusA family protein [Deltaproteobacteria bacterium]